MSESFAAGLVGIVLDDRYRLDALLGEGGMGAVYRAHHIAMDRRVAVKLLKPHLTTDDTALQRFVREARSTMKVESEHAVKVLDFGITPQRDYYMVLEYLDGRTVQQELDIDGPFAPARVVHVAKQALHALGAAHAKGLVHRDIKPDNLLLTREGDDADYTKVLDFGVAKLMEGAAKSSKSALAITQAGMVFGTPEFMSPEQACGQPLDGRSDLYSMAATMFAMLTGCGMFRAGSPIEWLTAHARTPPPHLADGLPALAPYTALDAALQTCLAKRREARPETAAAMIELLTSVERTLGGGTRPERGLAPAKPTFSSSSYISSIDPNATLVPEAAAMVSSAPATGSAPVVIDSVAPVAGSAPVVGSAPSIAAAPMVTSAGPLVTSAAPMLTGSVAPTTTGDIAALSRSRRGLWIVLGASAVLAMIVAVAIIASSKKRRDTDAVAKQVGSSDTRAGSASDTRAGSASDTRAGSASDTRAGSASDTRAGSASDTPAGASDTPAGSASETRAGSADAAAKKVPDTISAQKRAARSELAAKVAAHIAAAEEARRSGNRLRQMAEADAALQADPRNVRARFLFADVLITSGDLDRGCKYLRDLGKNPTAQERARQAGCPTN